VQCGPAALQRSVWKCRPRVKDQVEREILLVGVPGKCVPHAHCRVQTTGSDDLAVKLAVTGSLRAGERTACDDEGDAMRLGRLRKTLESSVHDLPEASHTVSPSQEEKQEIGVEPSPPSSSTTSD
jgi:hypothetical protein